jgi:uroporphyrin-III C-methyltransferase/precorrin-2 dehydrogenase/sirohydrochlorin ferrochelatase
VTLHSLPIFVRLNGRAVILVGDGEAAAAKRRLLERAGAVILAEHERAPAQDSLDPRLAIVVDDEAAVARLKARGILVNAVDRPELCDFTLPAIVDRNPVLVAIGTGGASAGLAAALRQRLEGLLPVNLGRLADALYAARSAWRARYPDATPRRRAIASALAPGGALDLLADFAAGEALPPGRELSDARERRVERMILASPDPDDLTLRQARLLANADRVTHGDDVPAAILDRARADADRLACAVPTAALPGLTVDVRMA